ncbi:MAG TPA: DHA2 family efflux MFS transporter permease subunit [Gaiellaceae bacterium]|nr:DHA2 family efflux MFS transporter permease subunit [Gaiellaceae bacterium]
MAQFMVVLDLSIVNVALPTIKTDLGFSESGLQWVITAYAIVFGGLLLLGGRLGDLYGRRRMFVLGLLVFAVGSALAAVAWSSAWLIAFRALQGAGGALFAPAGLSLLMTTFADGRDRSIAVGAWGAASGSGGAAGVLLGGVLTSYLSWPWIFLVNVPVGLAVAALAPRFISTPERAPARRHFDVAGAASVTASLMLLVYALTYAVDYGWSDPVTFGLLALSATLLAAFLSIERRAASPLMPLSIFRVRTLAAGNAITVVLASVGFSSFFVLALYLQQVAHYSAAQAGLAFTAIALPIAILSNAAGPLVGRFGARPVLALGLLLVAASQGYLLRLPAESTYLVDLLPAFLLLGIGMALSWVPVTIASLAGVAPADSGVASGISNTARQVGGAVGLALVSTLAAAYGGAGASGLTHGFHIAFGALLVLSLAAVAVTVLFLVPRRPPAGADEAAPEAQEVLAEAA